MQQAVTQQVLPQQLLDAVPTGGRNIQSIGATLVGVTQSQPDVGGAQGMQQTYLAAHGSDPEDNYIMIDGIRLNGIEGDGAIQQYFNEGMFSEMGYQTGGISAETSGGGVRLNMIPKDGGNTLKGDVFLSATGVSLQANPLTADLVARGLQAGNALRSIHDLNVSAGGPIKVNKVWFFGSTRHWGVNQTLANSFYPAAPFSPTDVAFTPDLSRQAVDNNLIKSFMTRATWPVSQKNKFSFYIDRIIKFRGHEQNSIAGVSSIWSEDTFSTRQPKQYYTAEAKWTGGLNISGTFQSYPGARNYGSGATNFDYLQQTYIVPAALLTPGQATETVNLNYPGSLYLPRLNQLDLRFARKFKLPNNRGPWQFQADLFNTLNAHPILAVATNYGSALGQVTQALQPRILTFGAQLHF